MNLLRRTRRIRSISSGSVTVDWMVMAAAIVGLIIAILTSSHPGRERLTETAAPEPSAGEALMDSFP